MAQTLPNDVLLVIADLFKLEFTSCANPAGALVAPDPIVLNTIKALRLTCKLFNAALTSCIFESFTLFPLESARQCQLLQVLLASRTLRRRIRCYNLVPTKDQCCASDNQIFTYNSTSSKSAADFVRCFDQRQQTTILWKTETDMTFQKKSRLNSTLDKIFATPLEKLVADSTGPQYSDAGVLRKLVDNCVAKFIVPLRTRQYCCRIPYGTYFNALNALPNLTTLVLGYPKRPDIRSSHREMSMATDFNIGLGRFLVRNPLQLRHLIIQAMYPIDLHMLNFMTTNGRELLSTSSAGSRLHLALCSLDISFDMCCQRYMKCFRHQHEIAPSLSSFLQLTPNLKSLSIQQKDFPDFRPRLSLRRAKLPPLPSLEQLRMRNVALGISSLLSLTTRHKNPISQLYLCDVALTELSWSTVFAKFMEDLPRVTNKDSVRNPMYDFSPAGIPTRADITQVDHEAAIAWEAMVRAR